MRKKPKNQDFERVVRLNQDLKQSNGSKLGKWIRRILYLSMIGVFFTIGLGLVFHQTITNKIVEDYATSYVDNTTPDDMRKNEEAEVSFDPSNVGSLTSADVLAEMTNGSNHYTDLPVVGAIAIPDLGMNLPIVKGLDNASLAVGAGTMKEGQRMGQGNYSLASHSLFYGYGYNNLLFTPLHRAQAGMIIYTRDADNIYVYEIDKVFVVNPDAGYVALDSEGDKLITLITCTDDAATQRIIVRGHLKQQFPIKEAWQELKDYFGSNWTRYW